MNDREKKKLELEAQISVLLQLEYVTAFTGTLDNIQQKSYVLFSEVLKLLNQKRSELRKIK
jgi:hypothetical protein